eukprot:gnl/TRDRNA2_/TRDRNA2_47409_c0_seq1.p1 gnl/TRDRNA2_/TRDRNA2_47409_c0~~gnl/TRDRNA2_/TRDRNA2_47409_c0_seq1.p1  ORF type:complete len:121 (-),score=17.88 gnl/TRDRNA2_/TRDRNA2_47409_c0_seq1:86-448(-)
MDAFTKGPWSHGLFDIDWPLCLINYFCSPCSLAQVHDGLSNPAFGKPIACLLGCCGAGSCQLIWYGQKAKGEAEPMMCAVLKSWLCSPCYLHQQYREHGCPRDMGSLVGTCMQPSQCEMS